MELALNLLWLLTGPGVCGRHPRSGDYGAAAVDGNDKSGSPASIRTGSTCGSTRGALGNWTPRVTRDHPATLCSCVSSRYLRHPTFFVRGLWRSNRNSRGALISKQNTTSVNQILLIAKPFN